MPKIERCDTTHIRVEVDVKNRLDALAQNNESARDVIKRLLEKYEDEFRGTPPYFKEEIISLEDIRRVIREEMMMLPIVSDIKNKDVTQDIDTKTPKKIIETLNSDKSSENYQLIKNNSKVGVTLTLTEEMRVSMRERLKMMKINGMNHEIIYFKTGIPEGTQKKILSPNQKLKSISPQRYHALMNE